MMNAKENKPCLMLVLPTFPTYTPALTKPDQQPGESPSHALKRHQGSLQGNLKHEQI